MTMQASSNKGVPGEAAACVRAGVRHSSLPFYSKAALLDVLNIAALWGNSPRATKRGALVILFPGLPQGLLAYITDNN